MAKISKELLREFVKEGFFDNEKTNQQVIEKLDTRGFSIKKDKAGLVAQLLAFLCQEGTLKREKDDKDNWRYKKI